VDYSTSWPPNFYPAIGVLDLRGDAFVVS
jgi:hypothetical protein